MTKHFLETSFLRPSMFGTSAYQRYFKEQLGDRNCYVSKYVKMEFNRSFLTNVINFYFILDLPNMETVEDAFNFWSNKFKTSELKAILQLAAKLFSIQHINFQRSADKPKALYALGCVIKRYYVKSQRRFKDTGQDSTRCARALVQLRAESENMAVGFKEFVNKFNDVESCRNRCRIDDFLLRKYESEVKKLTEVSTDSSKTGSGFRKIRDNLNIIGNKGPHICSCKMCEKIGDAVIALDTPRDMRLEHIDNSFDSLCPRIQQPHFKHPSEVALVRDQLDD